jgi:hypothetical protein
MHPLRVLPALALLACALPASAAFECTPGQPVAAIRTEFEREFQAIADADRKRQDEHRAALDALIDEIDAKRGWSEREKNDFLMALARNPEFETQEVAKRELGERLNAAIEAMERGGDACAHAREALSLFVQGLDANEKQWTFMRKTIGERAAATR